MFKKQDLVNDKTGEQYTKYFYTFNESDRIVGILFGHFAPFTGPNGHGRMVTALKKIGAESFLIVTPNNNKPFDDEREMFDAEQRAEIIQSYLDSEGLDGFGLPWKMKRGGAKSQMGPLVALAAEKFGLNIRPVFCFGPDREDLAAEVCNKFGEIEDPTHCEYIVDYERGTSGTKVRQLIKAGDIEGICKETGYKIDVAKKLIKLRTENMKMNESKFNESLGPIEIGAIGAYITLLIGAGFGANKLINKAIDFFEKGNEEAKEATGIGIKTSSVIDKAKEYLKILGKKFENEDTKNIQACVDEVIQKYGGKASASTLTQAVIGAIKKNYPDTFEKVYKDSYYSPDPRIVRDINKMTVGHSVDRTSDAIRKEIKNDYKIKDLTFHNKRNFGESSELTESFERVYNGSYKVKLDFSNKEDAKEFKNEMEDKFDFPPKSSPYEVVHGTTDSRNMVFIESFKKIYESSLNEPLIVFEDLAEEYGNEAGRDYAESIDGQVFSFKDIPFPIGEEETFKDRLSEKLPEYEVELYHSGERYWTRDGEHINKVTFKIFKKSLNESTQLLPLYHATEEIYDVQKAAERIYKERAGHKYNTHLYHFEGGNVFIVFTTITGWRDVQNLLVPIKKELQEEFESLKFDAGTCKYGGCIVVSI